MLVSTIWFTDFKQFFGFLMVRSVFFYFREDECKLGVNRQQGIYDDDEALPQVYWERVIDLHHQGFSQR